jgi:hypothetical protein
MMGKTLVSVAALAVAAFSTPASAATIIACGGGSNCVTGTTNVNLVGANDVMSGTGNIGIGGPVVNFSTTQAGGFDLVTGQASISAADPSMSLDNLLFSVATGFTAAEFNFNPLTGGGPPAPFSVRIITNTGADQTFTVGNQRFGILADTGETITSVQINTPTGAFGAFTQLRITPAAVNAVPEPGTWAMMLVGFGAIGASMRRRRRHSAALLQMA